MHTDFAPQLKDEIVLLRDAAKGGRTAYAKLYQFYLPKLYHYLYNILRSKPDAEEILQDIFLKLWENKNELANVKSLNNYLFTMARRRLMNIFDHQKVRQKAISYLSHQSNASSVNTDDGVVYKQYQDIFQRAVEQLPPKRRQVFELSMTQEMSNDEIARLMHISNSMVKKQLTAAKRYIKEYLQVHAGITAAIAIAAVIIVR